MQFSSWQGACGVRKKRAQLERITLRGFRSIRELDGFELRPLTVLIGANGAGKSNFLDFFRILAALVSDPPQLQPLVAKLGFASAILHDGPAVTPQIDAQLVIGSDDHQIEYAFRLAYAADDTLSVGEEKYRVRPRASRSEPAWISLGAGYKESTLAARARTRDATARSLRQVLAQCRSYHFHDTSFTSRVRQRSPEADNRWLQPDAGNLAAVLMRLKSEQELYYRRIVEVVRQVLPFFADFRLEPEQDKLRLRWREVGSDVVFGAHHASDGVLRTIALVTLLLQPEEDLPALLILDEPELGLHPYAIRLIAGLLRSASKSVQVLVATQSMTFVDQFEPQEVVVVDRVGRESKFRRLQAEPLKEWLEEYSLAELWEKNVVGGRPGR